MCDRGYIAPEVHQTGRLSTKADVYSFGVLILVTMTGYTIHNPRGNMTFERYVYVSMIMDDQILYNPKYIY